jgi:hypothetical protein
MYVSVALPRMMYPADVFLNPDPPAKEEGDEGVVTKFTSIPRAILITGEMRTTVTDVLDTRKPASDCPLDR